MRNLFRKLRAGGKKEDFSSKKYWESRYNEGGNSGSGSYGKLAEFKANVINDFVRTNNINSVIEYGCGDGNQLKMAAYPRYIGLDVSATAIKQCASLFQGDGTKSFFLYDGSAFSDNLGVLKCDLSMSLDVLYHLVEEKVYYTYLNHLFQSANKFVIIYSSNKDVTKSATASHERHREFTRDVTASFKEWHLAQTIPNPYQPKDWSDEEGSIADFYIFKNASPAQI